MLEPLDEVLVAYLVALEDVKVCLSHESLRLPIRIWATSMVLGLKQCELSRSHRRQQSAQLHRGGVQSQHVQLAAATAVHVQ